MSNFKILKLYSIKKLKNTKQTKTKKNVHLPPAPKQTFSYKLIHNNKGGLF